MPEIDAKFYGEKTLVELFLYHKLGNSEIFFFFRENFSTGKNQTNNRRFNVVKVIPLKMERFDVRIGLEIRGEVECCRFITNRFEARNPIDLKHAIQRQGQINKLSYMNGRSECALAEPY